MAQDGRRRRGLVADMPDLLLELFSEEIPARMQRQAAEDLKRLVTNALVERNLLYEGAQSFVTPRRLTLHVVGLPAAQAHSHEERKGPRVGAPDAAIQGFLKSAGLSRLEDARIETDPKKGQFYVAVIEKPGRETKDAIAEIIPAIIRSFPWPKSMRWGASSSKPEALRWVRPLRGIVCTLATQHETAEIVPFEIDGIAAGDVTWGHRFMAPQPIHVRRFDDYVDALQKAKVVLDADRRKAIILADAKDLAFAQGLTLVEDEGLLEEVAGLVEWPVVLMGEFEAAFLDLPAEVIRATIRANQKCFVLRDEHRFLPSWPSPDLIRGSTRPSTRRRQARNRKKPRRGTAWMAGTRPAMTREKRRQARQQVHPRLEPRRPRRRRGDRGRQRPRRARAPLRRAPFLADRSRAAAGRQGQEVRSRSTSAWRNSTASSFTRSSARRASGSRASKRWRVSLRQRSARTRSWRRARHISPRPILRPRWLASSLNCRDSWAATTRPSKAKTPSVAEAIEEHYKPQGPNDRIPTSPVSIAVALADKLDTLVGFWAIDEKPTGSKDPYALRRAALGRHPHCARERAAAALRLNRDCLLKQFVKARYRLSNLSGAVPMEISFRECGRSTW